MDETTAYEILNRSVKAGGTVIDTSSDDYTLLVEGPPGTRVKLLLGAGWPMRRSRTRSCWPPG